MREKLKELNDTLSEFVDQNDNLTLVIGADDTSMGLIVKMLEGIDEQNPSDLFVMFPEDAGAPDAYLTAMVARVEAQRKVANEILAKDGKPVWPEVPATCHDVRQPAIARLTALVTYLRGFLPPEGDHRLVLALLPLAINDRAAYAQIVGQLVPHEPIQAWMRGTRFIVRDNRDTPFLIPSLRKMQAPRVLVYQPDFSAAAVEAALTKEALDKDGPVPERMQALMQVAALDYAHQRFPQAIEKYGILFTYYSQSGAKEMQAICLQGVGDVLRRIGRLAEAKERYEQGLLLCADSQAVVIVMNLAVAAGDTSFELKQWQDAESYFTVADAIAGKIIHPFVKTDCMEKLGVIQQMRGHIGPAVRLWSDAAKICRQFEYKLRLTSLLERLQAAFQGANMRKEQREAEAELATLKSKNQGKPS